MFITIRHRDNGIEHLDVTAYSDLKFVLAQDCIVLKSGSLDTLIVSVSVSNRGEYKKLVDDLQYLQPDIDQPLMIGLFGRGDYFIARPRNNYMFYVPYGYIGRNYSFPTIKSLLDHELRVKRYGRDTALTLRNL